MREANSALAHPDHNYEARLKLRKTGGTYMSRWMSRSPAKKENISQGLRRWREVPSEALQRKELRDALKRAMAALPQKYREVLVLRTSNT